MWNRIYEEIEKERMMKDGDTVVAGVSGGADSVCLLYVLKEYAKIHEIKLIAAHIHHGLRDNADGDEAYVKALCTEWNVPLRVLHIDAKQVATDRKISVEEAGRQERYAFFRQILEEEKASGNGKIAVAHQQDDLCETMLFQLFRGSGISGLRGILPVSGNIIRPLLSVSRAEIENFLSEKGIAWREDESNEDVTYSRNRIRHEILPAAELVCDGAKEHMAKAAKRLREIEEYINAEADRAESLYVKESETEDGEAEILIRNEILDLPAALSGEILLRALAKVAGKSRDIGAVQVEALRDLYASQVGRKREFIYEVRAYREYAGIRLTCAEEKTLSDNKGTEQIDLPTREEDYPFLTKGDLSLECRIVPYDSNEEIPSDDYKKWFDYDIMKSGLCFRHPKEGDYITVTKEGGHKALKDYLKDEKIPARERGEVWVLAGGSNVWWVVGRRISEEAKVTEQTEKCLLISRVAND
ncbi:MAG: tRNA lysidine(34) synthetase TilS [Lachnospiraceae bacterium]|nr:tRNA lysidine(34) synthetase TilS [Lachnospiraceae bacterium]